MTKKTAVLFPGIGYHTDKPLLYYSKKLAKQAGYEILEIQYSGFKSKKSIRGNSRGMEEAFRTAYEDAEHQLDAEGLRASQVLFISKSIGTAAACAYAKEHGIPARQILYTPVELTFRYIDPPDASPDISHDVANHSSPLRSDIIVFHGTQDQWVDSPIVTSGCARLDIPIHIYDGANHSIETENVDTDLVNLRDIMHRTQLFIAQ